MDLAIPEAFFISAICFFCLLGLFLVSRQKSWRYGFGWLGVFFLLLAVNFLDGMMLLNGTLLKFPQLAFWEDPIALLYGPLIYFFTLHLRTRRWISSFFPHLLPFIVFELLVVAFHADRSHDEVIQVLSSIRSFNITPVVLIGIIPIFLHLLTYLLVARRSLIRHRDELRKYYSSIDLEWAFQLIQMVLFIFLISLLGVIVQYSGLASFFSAVLLLLNVLAVAMTLRLLLYSMNQPLFQMEVKASPAYGLSDHEMAVLKEKILRVLSEKKLFINPEMTLNDLAKEVGVSDRSVSVAINKVIGKNFYDLVNEHRIDHACRIFESNDDPKLTVLEVLYQAGFNSKSTFNTQFRKKTGLTPSEYKKRCLE